MSSNKDLEREAPLVEIAQAHRRPPRFLRRAERRQHQRREDGNDRNHHQQLNERKGTRSLRWLPIAANPQSGLRLLWTSDFGLPSAFGFRPSDLPTLPGSLSLVQRRGVHRPRNGRPLSITRCSSSNTGASSALVCAELWL